MEVVSDAVQHDGDSQHSEGDLPLTDFVNKVKFCKPGQVWNKSVVNRLFVKDMIVLIKLSVQDNKYWTCGQGKPK